MSSDVDDVDKVAGQPDNYALGRSAAETQRLILQNQIYGPFTRQLLSAAGITAGMKVLDLGSGAGDVALLLADLVGPEGRIVGIDTNADVLDTARTRVQAAGWQNLEFRHGDIQNLDVGDDFDAVVGRWVLMYVPDPVELLRKLPAHLRPGGIIAFQESDLSTPPRTYPVMPLHDAVRRWTTPPPGVPGPELEMGPKLYATFLKAGLPAPHLRHDAPIGGGWSWPGYAYVANTVRSLLPFMTQVGAARPDEVDIDTLEDRLRSEVVRHDGIQILAAVVGAWARI
jgi:SAM-dependent methyltransferase